MYVNCTGIVHFNYELCVPFSLAVQGVFLCDAMPFSYAFYFCKGKRLPLKFEKQLT